MGSTTAAACPPPETLAEDSDEALMARVQKQERDAFGRLVERHLDRVHAFGYRLTGNEQDAADIAQETMLRVWRKAHSWRPGRVQFTTWLLRIARNLCIDQHRRRRVQQPEEVDVDTLAGADDPGQAPERQRLRAALSAALRELPERQRTALVLCHDRGLTNPQAAEVLSVSVEAVESLLARARRTLRKALRDYA